MGENTFHLPPQWARGSEKIFQTLPSYRAHFLSLTGRSLPAQGLQCTGWTTIYPSIPVMCPLPSEVRQWERISVSTLTILQILCVSSQINKKLIHYSHVRHIFPVWVEQTLTWNFSWDQSDSWSIINQKHLYYLPFICFIFPPKARRSASSTPAVR